MESLARASTMRQERLSRCLQLLDILQSRIGHDIGRLASDFGVSRRTIHRDLRLLRDAGALLSYDLGKKGYTIDSSARLAPKSLFDEELLALLLAAQVSDLLRVPEICGLVDRAVGKLLGQASAACRTEAASLLSSVERQPSRIPWPKGTEDTCRTILMAIRRQRPLRIIYHAGPKTRGPIQTKVTLHRLVVSEATWQLVGRSSWHRRIYKFDIGLIRRAEQIDEIPAIKERRIGNPAIVPRNTSCAIG
ncbi:MAG: HTH domain-containing protein [Thermoguttaceae bacterium]|jgi:predicted DNA-binding transcriptional regulator YafY